jgi:hypothetical protein
MNAPTRINELLWAQWKTKSLEAAIKLCVFTELGKHSLTVDELTSRLKLRANARAVRDFFDSLVSLGLLESEGSRYMNSAETSQYLDQAKDDSYIGDSLLQGIADPILDLSEALRRDPPDSANLPGREFYEQQVRYGNRREVPLGAV